MTLALFSKYEELVSINPRPKMTAIINEILAAKQQAGHYA